MSKKQLSVPGLTPWAALPRAGTPMISNVMPCAWFAKRNIRSRRRPRRSTSARRACVIGMRSFAPQSAPCGQNASLDELREENKRLRQQLKRAELEREILKKATAYFAKESL